MPENPIRNPLWVSYPPSIYSSLGSCMMAGPQDLFEIKNNHIKIYDFPSEFTFSMSLRK